MQVAGRADGAAGMAGAGPDPAALLRLLLRHGRLEEAAHLALYFLDHWDLKVRPRRLPLPHLS